MIAEHAIDQQRPRRLDTTYEPASVAIIHRLKAGFCLGRVLAIAHPAPPRVDAWCIPENVTNGQIVQVVVSYIDARPDEITLPFLGLAAAALKDAWPCKK